MPKKQPTPARVPDGAMSLEMRGLIERVLSVREMHHADLAAATGIHPGELSKMMNRHRAIGIQHLRAIAKALNLLPGELLDAGATNPAVQRQADLDMWLESEFGLFAERVRNQARFVLAQEMGRQSAALTRASARAAGQGETEQVN